MEKRIFDSHLHIINPAFPLVANNGYLPPTFMVEAYTERVKPLGVVAGAVVSGSFQAFDQNYLLDALNRLGPFFVGVTQLPASTPDEHIQTLHEKGVRAIRFNLKRGGSESIENLENFAQRVYAIAGWHVELYIDSRDLPDLYKLLTRLPAVSIDHLGLTYDDFSTMLKLVESGVKVKATGFGRVNFSIPDTLKAIHCVNPGALMFGTDLPSTRAPRVFDDSDINIIIDALGEQASERVLWKNAAEFYRLYQ